MIWGIGLRPPIRQEASFLPGKAPDGPRDPCPFPSKPRVSMLGDRVGVRVALPPPSLSLWHCSWGQVGLLLGSSGTAEEGVGLGPGDDLGRTASLWALKGQERACSSAVGELPLVQVRPGTEQKGLGWRVCVGVGGDPSLRRAGDWRAQPWVCCGHPGHPRVCLLLPLVFSILYSLRAWLGPLLGPGTTLGGFPFPWARRGQSTWRGGQGGILGPVMGWGKPLQGARSFLQTLVAPAEC